MIQRCEIPIPPTANHIHRLVFPRPKPGEKQRPPFEVNTAEYESWLKQAGFKVRAEMSKIQTFPVRIRIEVYGGEGFPKSRDLDNLWKPTQDMIRKAGIIPNDRVKEVASIQADYFPPTHKGAIARCFIEVEELTDRAATGIQGELFCEGV